MFGLFEKRPESIELFSAAESAQFRGNPPSESAWLSLTPVEQQLYRALAREFVTSKKLRLYVEHKRKGDIVLQKTVHLIKRYDVAYAALKADAFKKVYKYAWNRAFGDHTYPAELLERLFIDLPEPEKDGPAPAADKTWSQWMRGEDITGRDVAAVFKVGGSDAVNLAHMLGELDKVASSATGGALSVFAAGRSLRMAFKAANREVVAMTYARQFAGRNHGDFERTEASDQFSEDEYYNDVLGFVANYAAGQAATLQRRKATETTGAALSAVGGILTATGLGAVAGIPIGAAGMLVGLAGLGEKLGRLAWKSYNGTKGVDRHEAATLLWINGGAGHPPTIQFMVDMGMLPVTYEQQDGYIWGKRDVGEGDGGAMWIEEFGYFEPHNFDATINLIMRKLRSS